MEVSFFSLSFDLWKGEGKGLIFILKTFPLWWSMRFKGGDASKFDSYRGIIVGLILAKLFVMILAKKLGEWAE